MAKITHLRRAPAQAPAPVNGKVPTAAPPKQVPNSTRRTREHLSPAEVERLIARPRARLGVTGIGTPRCC